MSGTLQPVPTIATQEVPAHQPSVAGLPNRLAVIAMNTAGKRRHRVRSIATKQWRRAYMGATRLWKAGRRQHHPESRFRANAIRRQRINAASARNIDTIQID